MIVPAGNNIVPIKVLHCAHILQVNKCSLLKIFLYDSQSLVKYIITTGIAFSIAPCRAGGKISVSLVQAL